MIQCHSGKILDSRPPQNSRMDPNESHGSNISFLQCLDPALGSVGRTRRLRITIIGRSVRKIT